MMKTLKVKFITFSLLAAVVLSVFMTSCEQEALLTDGITTRQSYIVMFKADDKKSTDLSQQFKGKSREEVVEITQRMQRDFKTKARSTIQKTGIKSERIKNYYESIEGLNMMLTTEEAAALAEYPFVESVEADRKFEVNLPKIENRTMTKVQKSGDDWLNSYNVYHGGDKKYEPNGSHKSTWIWMLSTGIDLDHPDLNIITDDFYAKSFVGEDTPDDWHGYGTQTASVAAAKANGQGFVGMSEGAKLVPLQIFGGDYPGTTESRTVDALNHLYSRSIPGDVVSIAWAGQGVMSNTLKTAMDRLNDRGVYIVMSAGNGFDESEGNDVSGYVPASYNNTHAITVANGDRRGLEENSNYGASIIDYIAIGGDGIGDEIYAATIDTEESIFEFESNGGIYGPAYNGTGISSAVVAGIIHGTAGVPKPKLVYDGGEYYVMPLLWQ